MTKVSSSFSIKNVSYEQVLLFLITTLALTLRLWQIDFYLPQTYSGLEHPEVMRSLELGMGKFNFSRITKGGLFYLLFVEYGIFYVVLRLFGIVQSSNDFAVYFLQDPSPFFMIGRITSVLMGTISIVAVYFLGKKVHDYRVGLLAAFFFALNPIHIEFSHYICIDIPMTLYTIISFYGITQICERDNLKTYIVTGLFIALAVMHKFPAIILTLPFFCAHCFRLQKKGIRFTRWIDRKIILGYAVFGVIYILGAPGILLEFQGLVKGVLFLLPGGSVPVDSPYSGITPNLWLIHTEHLINGLGWPLFLFVLAGIFISIRKGSSADKCLSIFVLVFFVGVCVSGFREWGRHYILPIFPLAAILASKAILQTIDHLKRIQSFEKVALPALLLLISLPLLSLALSQAHQFDLPHTRSLAKDWIQQNIAPGAKIRLFGFPGIPYSRIVGIHDSPENLLKIARKATQAGKPVKAKFNEMQASIDREIVYNLDPVQTRRTFWQSPEDYRQQKVEYIVLDEKYFDEKIELQYSEKLHHSRRKFYKQLTEDPEVSLVQRFDPTTLNAHGPRLEIYKISE